MKLKIMSFVLVLSLLVTGVGSFASELPEGLIKVGLKYGSVTNDVETITSENGFDIAFKNGNTVSLISDLSHEKVLKAKKDDGYHIQVGPVYGTLPEMLGVLSSLRKKDTSVYPVFENGWKIYYGSYSTKAKAEADISKVKSKLGSNVVVTGINSKFVQINGANSIVFIYESGQNDFFLRASTKTSSNVVVGYNTKTYRGGIGFKRYPDSVLTVINYISLDDYLYGVLPKEMSGSWPLEALKAQAIAARNFAVASMGKHSEHGFDICSTTDCQVYGGHSVEKPRSNQAVDESSGKLLKYNGKIVQAYYHSNSGGQTENIENIWTSSLPYIVGVHDPYSVGSPNTDWELSYTLKEIENILSKKGYSIGTLKDVRIEEVSENGRVQKLVFIGSAGKAELIKEKSRALFGYTTLKSMWFELGNKPMVTVVSRSSYSRTDLSTANYVTANGIESSNNNSFVVTDGQNTDKLSFSSDKVVFRGHGFGHGLGMSQWGAKVMAESGFDYEQILTHYYKNTIIE